MRRLLGSNSLWAIVANGSGAAAQWFVVVLIARYAGATALGQYALATALAAPIFMCLNMRLRFVQAADVNSRFSRSTFVGFRVGSSALAAVLVVGTASVHADAYETLSVPFAVAVAKAVEAMQDIFYGALQAQERMRAVALSQSMTAFMTLGACWLALSASGDIALACWAMAGVRTLLMIAVDVPSFRGVAGADRVDTLRSHGRASLLQDCRALLVLAWPLGIVAFLDSATANVPRYLLSSHDSIEAVGVFAAMSYFAFAGFLIVNSVGQSHAPRLARLASHGHDAEFSRGLRRIVYIAASIGVLGTTVAWLRGDWILAATYGHAVAAGGPAFPLVMAAGGLNYIALVMVHGLSARGLLRYQMPLYAAGFIACLVAGAMLIPDLGLVGAGWAALVAGVLQVAVASWAIMVRR